MGSGNFYPQIITGTKKTEKGSRFGRSLLLSGILLFCIVLRAAAQPVFTGGFIQTLTVCQNSGPVSIDYLLTVNDAVGHTDTWDVVPSSYTGTLSGLPNSAASGTGVTTSGVTYTPPVSGGADVFTISVSDGVNTVQTTIQVTVLAPPTLALGASPVICTGTGTASISYSALTGVGPVNDIYTAPSPGVGVGPIPWTVPAGVTTVNFDVQGAAGGSDNVFSAPIPGKGGRLQGTLAVTPGQTINFFVGSVGGNGTTSGATGGFNGGGNAFYYPGVGTGGGGGGASDIRVGGTALTNRVVVAGGGGGSGWDSPFNEYAGGDGGGLTGGASQANVGGSSSMGGTQTSGGAPAFLAGWTSGSAGTLGTGGDGSTQGVSGGGGGGYYGGGGGIWNGGGGGSSFADPAVTALITHTQGYNTGDGVVGIHYNNPGTYNITWDASAAAAGFANVTGAVLTPSPITFAVPTTLSGSAVYNATLTISNGMCSSDYAFTLTVNQTPDVTPISSSSICNGVAATSKVFSGAVVPTDFNWVTDNTTIGVAGSGLDSIPAFTATNSGTAPSVANFTVTPSANGCTGTPATFQIVVNPTPMLSTADSVSVCDSVQLNYPASSLTAGTGITWTRAAVPGIVNTPGSGPGNPMEYLDNSTPLPVAVTYTFSLTANGCSNTQNVIATVNPTPMLNTAALSLTPPGVCSGTPFNYPVSTLTPGTTIRWSRNIVTGITSTVGSGFGNPMEPLTNVSAVPVPVPYDFIMTANGCQNIQTAWDTVYPTPTLTSVLTNTPICSGQTFSYVPTSGTPGATFQWNRIGITGLAEGAIVGSTAPPTGILTDTISTPITVTYQFTAIANGCNGPQTDVTVLVKPMPKLASSNSVNACDGLPVNYVPMSNVSGTSFVWRRDPIAGISNNTFVDTNIIKETLHDTTNHPVTVNYNFYLNYLGCMDTEVVKVTVNPSPVLTSPLAAGAICDSTLFNYRPTSNTTGATFAWSRAYTAGIANPPASGSGAPNEHLFNSTNVNVNVAYMYTVMANGCSSTPKTVTVTVHPLARLSSSLSGAVCTGVPFTYAPTSYVAGASFDWIRRFVKGINPTTAFGTSGVSETLVNSTDAPINIVYLYRVTANGCENPDTQRVVITVNNNPSGDNPSNVMITPNYPTSLCSSTTFVTLGAGAAPEPGVSYTWSSNNAVVWALSNNTQYAYVNFNNPGTATISMTATVRATGCKVTNTATVDVGSSSADNVKVVYIQGQFVALENDVDTYQWGYDDVNTFQSVSIDGAVNQNFFEPNPDFGSRHYWVMTVHNGCTQKSFYNAPQGPVQHRSGSPEMRIYPNPVTSDLTVEMLNFQGNDLRFVVTNMLGQTMIATTTTELKSIINASSLAPGGYLIDCFSNDTKIATARFIKN
jgi:hypothetical protein